MRNLSALILTAAFLSVSACAEKINIQTEKKKILAVLNQYHKALEIEDIGVISTIYAHDDDIVQFNDTMKWVGWKEVKSGFEEWFNESDSIKYRFRDDIVKVNVSGKAAWVSFIQDGSMIYENQHSSFIGTMATWALAKQEDNWVIIQAHYTTMIWSGIIMRGVQIN